MNELSNNDQRSSSQPTSYKGKAKLFTAGLIVAGVLLVVALALTVFQFLTMPA